MYWEWQTVSLATVMRPIIENGPQHHILVGGDSGCDSNVSSGVEGRCFFSSKNLDS